MATIKSERGGKIWVDVEDFFDYFRSNPYPSGIQRLAYEIEHALVQACGTDRIRFLRRGPDGVPREVAWAGLTGLMAHLQTRRAPVPAPTGDRTGRSGLQQWIATLPEHLRAPLFRAGLLQLHAGRNWRTAAQALHRRRRRQAVPAQPAPELAEQPAPLQPGDRYLALGAPWAVPGFADAMSRLKQRYAVSAHALLYDLIPVRHPEWCAKPASAGFRSWLDASLPLFDGLLAISRHTAADVQAYAGERGFAMPANGVRVVPLGIGLSPRAATPPGGLPKPGSYALFVSTLEVRKNHELLVRVWRRLDDDIRAGRRRAEHVPALVFAGRVGSLVADLLQQLDNMRWLNGRIRLIRDPSDDELRALYAGCLFTMFPSWSEGWGLPVAESLAHGKPCLASTAAALPEAGGTLCRYFDPGDTGEAYRAVTGLLDDPEALAAWQAQIRREFRPAPWSDTARAVLDALAA